MIGNFFFQCYKFDQDLDDRKKSDSRVGVDVGEFPVLVVRKECKRAQRDERTVRLTGQQNGREIPLSGSLEDRLVASGFSVGGDDKKHRAFRHLADKTAEKSLPFDQNTAVIKA